MLPVYVLPVSLVVLIGMLSFTFYGTDMGQALHHFFSELRGSRSHAEMVNSVPMLNTNTHSRTP